jgi:hypothetical protein
LPSVTTINNNAFATCTALKSVTLGDTPPTLGINVFPADTIITIYVPKGAKADYETAAATKNWTPELVAMIEELPAEPN